MLGKTVKTYHHNFKNGGHLKSAVKLNKKRNQIKIYVEKKVFHNVP